MILDAAQRIVETQGASQLSAREIAREIGYAPGTLYNLFRNLDEILLHVEAELLTDLDRALSEAMESKKGAEAVHRFASRYAAFAYDHSKLWTLLQEHHLADGQLSPDWYLDKINAPIARLEPALAKISGTMDVESTSRTARALWSAIHGIIQIATTEKFGRLSKAAAMEMVEDVVHHYVAGLAAQRTKRSEPNRPGRDATACPAE